MRAGGQSRQFLDQRGADLNTTDHNGDLAAAKNNEVGGYVQTAL